MFRRNNPALESSAPGKMPERPGDLFDDDYHRHVFSRLEVDLCSSQLAAMANTIPFGKIYERKLRVEQYWRNHPDAQSMDLPKPV